MGEHWGGSGRPWNKSHEQQHACYYTEPTPATFIHPPIHPSITLTLASCLTSLTWKGFWSSIGSGKLVYFDISLAASLKKPPRTRWCQRWSKKREEEKKSLRLFPFQKRKNRQGVLVFNRCKLSPRPSGSHLNCHGSGFHTGRWVYSPELSLIRGRRSVSGLRLWAERSR